MPGARLTLEQRRTIERCYRIGLSYEQIGAIVGKHKSTVSREVGRSFSAPGARSPKRHTARGGGQGYQRVYTERAQTFAEHKAHRPKPRRLDRGPLREKVWELLRADWSPEQFSKTLPTGSRRSNLKFLTMTECDDVALRLNTRPRKTLEWKTPGQVLNQDPVATAG